MWQSVIRVANFNKELLRRMLADIPEADMCKQPPGLPNHPTWLVGHLAFVRFAMAKQMGHPPSDFPDSWAKLFGRNSTPVDDASQYPPKEELWGTFERAHEHALRVASELSSEQLAGTHAIETLRPAFPTLGDLLVQMLTSHDGLHVGQLSDWRRANGLPRMIQ